jgi:hypothetical protein
VDKTATTYIVLSYPLWLVTEEGTIKTSYVVVLSVMDHHLPQALNRVVTIKTRYIVVILSGMDHLLPDTCTGQTTYGNKSMQCTSLVNVL